MCVDVLKAIQQPKNITHIMYATHINYGVAKQLVMQLKNMELCREHTPLKIGRAYSNMKEQRTGQPKRKQYVATLKGIHAINLTSQLSQELPV